MGYGRQVLCAGKLHLQQWVLQPGNQTKRRERPLRSSSLSLAVFSLLAACIMTGCEDGDWLGPFERGLRAAVNGWDMWATESVRPYEEAMPKKVEGTVPVSDRFGYETGRAALKQLSADQRKQRSALTYRRYCHHCHGPNGDGRIIVGESLEVLPTDLREDSVQSLTQQELFEYLKTGGDLMPPLNATMSPLEMLLAAEYLTTLKDRPSRPYYPPKNIKPLE